MLPVPPKAKARVTVSSWFSPDIATLPPNGRVLLVGGDDGLTALAMRINEVVSGDPHRVSQ